MLPQDENEEEEEEEDALAEVEDALAEASPSKKKASQKAAKAAAEAAVSWVGAGEAGANGANFYRCVLQGCVYQQEVCPPSPAALGLHRCSDSMRGQKLPTCMVARGGRL